MEGVLLSRPTSDLLSPHLVTEEFSYGNTSGRGHGYSQTFLVMLQPSKCVMNGDASYNMLRSRQYCSLDLLQSVGLFLIKDVH